MNQQPNKTNMPLKRVAEEDNHRRLSGKKRPIIPSTPSFKCPRCMCGNNDQCSRFRKIFKAKDDPLKRHTYHKVKFPSDKPKWQHKVDTKKAIYEKALGVQLEYDKDYHLATLHFHPQVLAYCQGSKSHDPALVNKNNPTLAFKQSEWQDMIEAGLAKYLPPTTLAFQCKEYGDKPICFLPPNVRIQEVEYSLEAEQALESVIHGRPPQPREPAEREPYAEATPHPQEGESVQQQLEQLQHLIWSVEYSDKPSTDATTAILKQMIAGRCDVASELYKKAHNVLILDKAEISEYVRLRVDPGVVEILFPGLNSLDHTTATQRTSDTIVAECLLPQLSRNRRAHGGGSAPEAASLPRNNHWRAGGNNDGSSASPVEPIVPVAPRKSPFQDLQEEQTLCSFCKSVIAGLQDKQESAAAAEIPEEIRAGVQSSLSLCLSQDQGKASIPTEAGKWVNDYARTKNNPNPLHGLQMLAYHACHARHPEVDFEEYFNTALSLGDPTEAIPETPNTSSLARGENWKQMPVQYEDDSGNFLTVWENLFLVRSQNAKQAYKLTAQSKHYLNDYGPKSGTIEYAVVLPACRADSSRPSPQAVQFRHPPAAAAQYVSIKRINKEKVKQYQEDGGYECPYREIALLQEVGDGRHVHQLVEALEDDDFLYIVNPYTENRCTLREDKSYNDYCDLLKSDQELRGMFVNVLEIIEHLHRHDLYHSALTPEYLVIDDDRVLLTRMGLAMKMPRQKHRNRPFKVPLGPLDTLSFQAPEVHSQGSILNSSANLWSAAITLHFMVTGRTLCSIPHPSDAGFRMFMSLGNLEEMMVFLDNAAVANNMQVANRGQSHHALKLLSNLLRLKPTDRWSPEQALEAAKQWW